MVTKLQSRNDGCAVWFESCVVLDGNQTESIGTIDADGFESCVVLDGNQTAWSEDWRAREFESCVVLDGNQTYIASPILISAV